MSIFNKIWRLFKVTKVLLSLNSMKLARLLSSPTPHRSLQFIPQRSPSICISDDIADDQEYNISKITYHRYENEAQRGTPWASASTTPFPVDSSPNDQLSHEEDINKRAEAFISKMKRQISLDVVYARSRISPIRPPISPDSFLKTKGKSSFSNVQSANVSRVPVKPSSVNIRYPNDTPRMKKRPSLVVNRPIEIT